MQCMRFKGVLLSLLLTLTVGAQQRLDTRAVDRLMAEALRTWQIPGASIVVVQDDRIVYAKGYGVKERGGEPVTADTLFQIGSASKAFTTTALAILVSEGKLSWDDPVRERLDGFRVADACAESQITIRDISSHRTGLPRRDELWDNTFKSREEVIGALGKVPLAKPIRTAYQYNNIMFIAAGEVVAQTSGVSWDEFVKSRIFAPLQMTRSTTSDEAWKSGDHAVGHRWWSERGALEVQPLDPTKTIGPAGAVMSTAGDMGNWIRFQLANGVFEGKQLLAAEALAETHTPQMPIRMSDASRKASPETNLMAYGLGWVVQDYRGELLVSHAGALNGFRAHVDLLPEKKSGFAIMINAGRGTALAGLRNALIDLLTGKPSRDWNAFYLALEAEGDAKEKEARAAREAKRVKNTNPSRPLESYAGTYSSKAYGEASITIEEGRPVFHWNRLAIPLEHYHYDVFTARSDKDWVEEDLVFQLAPDGGIASFEIFGETFARGSY